MELELKDRTPGEKKAYLEGVAFGQKTAYKRARATFTLMIQNQIKHSEKMMALHFETLEKRNGESPSVGFEGDSMESAKKPLCPT